MVKLLSGLTLILFSSYVLSDKGLLQFDNIETTAKLIDLYHDAAYKIQSSGLDSILAPHSVFKTPKLVLDKLRDFAVLNVSETCSKAFVIFAKGLIDKEKWAWNMLDSYGKIGSGISQGNLVWPGKFSLCKEVVYNGYSRNKSDAFQGQFCWLEFSPNATTFKLTLEQQLLIKLRIGICVPDSCDQSEIEPVIKYINDIPITNHYGSLSAKCVLNERSNVWHDTRAVICLSFCMFITLLLLIGTGYDLYTQSTIHLPNQEKGISTAHQEVVLNVITNFNSENLTTLPNFEAAPNDSKEVGVLGKVLLSFSLYTNASKLLNCSSQQQSLTCLNGIRVFSMLWVILGHTYYKGLPLTDNSLVALEWTKSFEFLFVAGGIYSVDTFFALSGVLVTYVYLKEYTKRNGKISWLQFYVHRYIRLTPVYAVVLFIFENVLSRYYIDGPFYPTDGLHGDACDKYWWWNLLYINNFQSSDMCMGQAWYLANDMQFYAISPLILIFIHRWFPGSVIIGVSFILINWITSGIIATEYSISASLIANADNSDAFFYKVYYKPYNRIAAYIIGMVCGYLLFKGKCQTKLNTPVVIIGWLTAIGLSSSVIFGTYHLNASQDVSSLYIALSRSAWALAVVWIIFACCNGYGGLVNSILSWPLWQPFARLTYTTFLIHLVILHVFLWGVEVAPHFSHIYMMSLFLGVSVLSYCSAILLSLAFEAPILGLEKLLL